MLTVTSSRTYLNQFMPADHMSLEWTAYWILPHLCLFRSAGLSTGFFRGTAITYIKAYLDAFKCGPFLRDPVFHGSPRTSPQTTTPTQWRLGIPLETQQWLRMDVTLGNWLPPFSLFQLKRGSYHKTTESHCRPAFRNHGLRQHYIALSDVFSVGSAWFLYHSLRNPMLLQVHGGFFVNTGAVQERPW